MGRWIQILGAAAFALAAGAGVAAPADDAVARERALAGLASDKPGARREAYAVLGAVGREADLPLLYSALYDPDPIVRGLAQDAIWRVWGRSGDEEIDRLYAVAMEQMESGRLQPAVRTLTRVIEQRPSFTEAWNKRATLYFMLGENDLSIADCDEVLARNPQHFGALAGYGQLMLRKGELKRALDYFERALAVNPNLIGVAAGIEALREALSREGGARI